MADIVTAAATDSTNDGVGPDLSPAPPQLDNVADELLLMAVSTSRNAGNGSAPTVNTPAGWDLQYSAVDNELRHYVFSRVSTGGDTFPTLTSVGTASEWSCVSVVVRDVDYVNGPFGDSAGATGGGDQNSPNLTFTDAGAASYVLSFFGLERRTLSGTGFRSSGTDPGTVLLAQANSGTAEGVDNLTAVGGTFFQDPSGTFDGPFWEASGGGDSIAFNIEVLTLNNIRPLVALLPPSGAAPAITNQLNQDWCDFIIDSGFEPDGTPLEVALSFDAALADTGANTITITDHDLREADVYRVEANGNTLPTGLTDGGLYWVRPTSADALQLVQIIADPDATSDLYVNGTAFRAAAGITAAGSGTCLLRPARINSQNNGAIGDIYRPSSGSGANVGAFSNGWNGDSGYSGNWLGAVGRYNSLFDATGETVAFTWTSSNSNGRWGRFLALFIDEDGDWITFNLYNRAVNGSTNVTDRLVQIQPASTAVQALAEHQQGTFDGTRIRYFGLLAKGSGISTTRPNTFLLGTFALANPLTVAGASANEPTDLPAIVTFLSQLTDAVSQPSDLQVVLTSSLQLGDASNEIFFEDSEKSIAFPPLADGVNSLENYLESLGVTIFASGASNVSLQNSQIGASVPFDFEVNQVPGATVAVDGNTYVFGNVALDADQSPVARQLFVGGSGIADNGAEITGSTFIVNEQLGADAGMVSWTASTNITGCTFSADDSLVTGHAIIIETPGTYSFSGLQFEGFGVDGSTTAAVFNNSGGAVTINVSGGTAPTVRNGAGASTTVNAGATITLTGVIANSEVRLYRGTVANAATAVEIDGVEVSGTSVALTHSDAGQAAYVVIHKEDYENLVISFAALSATDQTIPVQQRFDRVFANP